MTSASITSAPTVIPATQPSTEPDHGFGAETPEQALAQMTLLLDEQAERARGGRRIARAARREAQGAQLQAAAQGGPQPPRRLGWSRTAPAPRRARSRWRGAPGAGPTAARQAKQATVAGLSKTVEAAGGGADALTAHVADGAERRATRMEHLAGALGDSIDAVEDELSSIERMQGRVDDIQAQVHQAILEGQLAAVRG